MRMRDGWFLVVGAAMGAALLALSLGREEPVRPRIVPPAASSSPAPVPDERSAAPLRPPEPAPVAALPSPVRSEADLRLEAARLELGLQKLLLRGAGSGEPAKKGYPGNPHAGMSRDELADARTKAAEAVEPLLERWRGAATGADRASAMKDLALPLFRLLEAGGPMEHLLTLEESAERGETAEERRWAVIATHRLWQPEVVDFLLARAGSPHAEVRMYAVEGLAWVRGDEGTRAVERVVLGLDDSEAKVRAIAAVALGTIVADPARAEAILDRLAKETDAGAAWSMAEAVLALDGAAGRERLTRAAGAAPEAVKAAVEKALAAK